MSTKHRLVGTGLAAAVIASGAVGCKETVEGEFLATKGIAMVVDVTAKSTSDVEVEAQFLSGGDESNTFVNLKDDEVFIQGGKRKKLASTVSEGVYRATFDEGQGGTKYSVSLERKDPDFKDAPDSSGTLPEPFSITLDEDTVSRQDALTIRWSPSGDADSVRLDLDGDCIFFTFDDDLADDGEHVIPAKDLIFGNKDDKEETCEVTVTLTRTRRGKADGNFDGESKFWLHQVRSTKFTSTL